MKNLKFIIKEHINNWYRIKRLSFYDFIAPLRDTYLGYIWILLNPLLQISVYWIVFGLGIRQGRDVEGHPFLLWMLAGIVPWFYISQGIASGATSLYSKSAMLTKMKFPSSIISTCNTLSILLANIPLMVVLFIIYAFYGYNFQINFVQVIYYYLAATILIISITFTTSSLVMAMRDVNKLVGTVLRFIFYFTPILWIPTNKSLKFVMKLNPFTYIVEGFRNSLLYEGVVTDNIKYGIYFWSITFILLAIGVSIHMKLRHKFTDMV